MSDANGCCSKGPDVKPAVVEARAAAPRNSWEHCHATAVCNNPFLTSVAGHLVSQTMGRCTDGSQPHMHRHRRGSAGEAGRDAPIAKARRIAMEGARLI